MKVKWSIWASAQYLLFTVHLFAVACNAWGYHHPAAIRLPTDKPTTTTTTTTTQSTSTTQLPPSTVESISTESTIIASVSTYRSSISSTTTSPTVIAANVTITEEITTIITSDSNGLIISTTSASTAAQDVRNGSEPTSPEATVLPSTTTEYATSAKSISTVTEDNIVAYAASTSRNLSEEATSSSPSATTAELITSTSAPEISTSSLAPQESKVTLSTKLPPIRTTSASGTPAATNTSTKACVRNESQVSYWDFGSCTPNCTVDLDCNLGQNERCVCDGTCGLSCLSPDLTSIYCDAPRPVENGKALLVGDLGLYDYRNQLQRFKHNEKVVYECDEGFSLIDGPQEKICRIGLWFPAVDEPKCIFSDSPGFKWLQHIREKRRAIKSGSASTRIHSKLGGARRGGHGGGRRSKKKGENAEDEEEEVEVESSLCPGLELEPFVEIVELLVNGTDGNNTYDSEGAVVRVSCSQGYGVVNLANDTIVCENEKWKPKIPRCEPLACKVPFVAHGTFYLSGHAMFFLEQKKHGTNLDLRCSKGFGLMGPSHFHCSFGEWDIKDAPECIPGSCNLPQLDRGSYASRHRPGTMVGHGMEVDYHCDGETQKMAPGGPAKCHLGEWRPNKPACFIPSYIHGMKNFTHDKDNKLVSTVKRSCGLPRKEKGAIFYVEGKPIDYDTDYIFPDSTEVMYRCATSKPKPKNRWKMTCEDGQWIGGNSNITCEMNATIVANITSTIKETIRMINSTCSYKKKDTQVVSFFNDKQFTMEASEFPHGSVLVNRCIDIGKFVLLGAITRKCFSGQWLGITPKCEGLSQYYDYIVDKPPTILFRYLNGSIIQTNDGKLMVYPGTTVHMECLYIRRFGRPSWNVSNSQKVYPEGWTDGIENRDPSLEYRLTIEDASDEDSGHYACITPSRYSHQVEIIVKKLDCPPLPEQHDLIFSTDSTMLGTRVTFLCRDNNTLIGDQEIVCLATGSWSASLPRCENVECADISLVPAMGPLAHTSVTRNGTLKKNETAPPKISIGSRFVGGKVVFSCSQGFMVEGATEAVCQSNGEWSSAIPLCREVECHPPPSPENGFVSGNAPYKAGDLAQFECKPGYMMEGQPIIACQDNGKWSRASSTTKCVKACTYPGTTIGGTISAVKFYYSIGETVEFDCTEGYDLKGSRMLHCLESAQWSTTIPNCIPRDDNVGPGLIRTHERK